MSKNVNELAREALECADLDYPEMELKNSEKFFAWLRETLKADTIDELAYLEDVFKQYGETGTAIYEVGGSFTNSGKPECIRFDVEEIDNQDGTFTTIISF